MLSIGIYDSGIGGLTTLKELVKNFGGQNFVYFADNANMPFGTKSADVLEPLITKNLDKLRNISDLQVVACNTASTLLTDGYAFTLKPKLENYSPKTTLLLSTPITAKNLNAEDKGYTVADTKYLASLVEAVASISFKHKSLDFSPLYSYIDEIISRYEDKTDILIGCSHYVYLENLIQSSAKYAYLDDGNRYLIEKISRHLNYKSGLPKIKFIFSGTNESEKYTWLLSEILK